MEDNDDASGGQRGTASELLVDTSGKTKVYALLPRSLGIPGVGTALSQVSPNHLPFL